MEKLIAIIKVIIGNLIKAVYLWFGLRLLLTKRLSTAKTYDQDYDLGYWIMLKFKLITLAQWITQNPQLLAEANAKNMQQALTRLKHQVGNSNEAYRPVDIVSPDIDPDSFYKTYVKDPKPVVIRGLANDLDAVGKWNADFLSAHYGDTKTYLRVRKESSNKGDSSSHVKHWIGKLSEMLSAKVGSADGGKILFTKYPELKEDIAAVPSWKKFLGNAMYLTPQVFMGYSSGAAFHCAPAWNFSVMVDGKKRWTLVNPEHSLQMGALICPSGMSVDGCVTGKGNTWRDATELYTKYCPKYQVDLEPGDVLLNPPWWWHEITNLTPFSIAIATRWFVSNQQKNNFLFEFIQMVSPTMWFLAYHTLLNSQGSGSGKLENDDILREIAGKDRQSNVSFIKAFENRGAERISIGKV